MEERRKNKRTIDREEENETRQNETEMKCSDSTRLRGKADTVKHLKASFWILV